MSYNKTEQKIKELQTVNKSNVIGSLQSIFEVATCQMEEKAMLHNYHEIGQQLEILSDVYIIAQEMDKIQN